MSANRKSVPKDARPRVAAVIPVRGGSKGIPGKNLARVGGVSLTGRAVRSAIDAKNVDLVVVSTDDAAIANEARDAGAYVIARPKELAVDTASSESALLDACDRIEIESGVMPEVLVFIQATSPFIDSDDIDGAVGSVLSGDKDCVFSAVATYEFLWEILDDDARGVNHDRAYRPRRQEREPHYRETGAFYVMSWSGFRKAHHRFFGRVGVQPVDERFSIEIDTAYELEVARAIAPLRDAPLPAVGEVAALVMDFDGVHTDDHVYVDSNGLELIRASRGDGLGIGMLRDAGLPMVIISKERNPVVSARASKLGIPVLQGIDAKASATAEWAKKNEIDLKHVAYVGNDVNDLPAMAIVGWPVAVSDAHPRVLMAARLILHRSGGAGALRELADLLLANNELGTKL